MPELKELFTEMGLSESLIDKPMADVWKEINSKYVSRATALEDQELVDTFYGHTKASLDSAASRHFGKYGLKKEELKGKKPGEIFDMGFNLVNAKMKELEDKANSSGNADERITKIQSEFEKVNSDYKALQEVNSTLTKQMEEKETQMNQQIKDFKVKSHFSSLVSKINLIPDDAGPLVPTAKKGFWAGFNEKYTLDLEEAEGAEHLIIRDKSGKQIQSEAKNKFLSPEDVIKKEAEAAKLLQMNNASAGRGAFSPGFTPTKDAKPVNGRALPPRTIPV